ncbi:probable pectinesterase 66 isoform X2 [Hordeum vulgare subsp. vulgare]|uniref:probable pectinesterase 66 isoform X2 n=1 Tax=Hordeum vulgare subsp. vulgare TaxID=112509 RepID=UPI001D1A331F|nr:probable pectinesterase 66 isoform X2 [Hordeum vulgare subsp. vulgare]
MRPFCLLVVGAFLLLRWPPLSLGWAQVARTITVDQNGGGDYRTVQSAVNAVPDGNRQWVRIYVKQGSYREKVTIPSQKGFILLQGDGSFKTDINLDGHGDGTDAPGMAPITGRHDRNLTNISPTYTSATFTVHADNFVARNIAFKNTFNGGYPAVAMLVDGDKSAFYDCAFHGFQDTLCDLIGRHYFHHCLVVGGVDFIFGYGQSIYEGCTLVSNMPASSQQPGWVTAHGGAGGGRNAALVFKGGMITGSGRQYLGRAWNEHATVVFYQVTGDVCGGRMQWPGFGHGGKSDMGEAHELRRGAEGEDEAEGGEDEDEDEDQDDEQDDDDDDEDDDDDDDDDDEDDQDHDEHRAYRDCCRWLKEVEPGCVCEALLRLPMFLVKPQHKYTIRVGKSCEVTYRCGGR